MCNDDEMMMIFVRKSCTSSLGKATSMYFLHCTLSLAAQCFVISPVCGFVAVFVCVGGLLP